MQKNISVLGRMSRVAARAASTKIAAELLVAFLALGPIGISEAKENFFGVDYGFTFIKDTGRYDKDCQRMQQAGVQAVRLPVIWGDIEVSPGRYDFKKTDAMVQSAKKHNIKIQANIHRVPLWSTGASNKLNLKHLRNYKAFIRACVRRYKNDIKEWEIWLEPANKFWAGTADDYFKLLKISYETIKKTDPDAIVIGLSSGSLGWTPYRSGFQNKNWDFISRVMELGGGKYMDAVSVHPYRVGRSPDQKDELIRWTQYEEIERLDRLVNKSIGFSKDIYITEIGWATDKRVKPINENKQAAYLARLYITMFAHPLVKRVNWFFWNEGDYKAVGYGLIRLDGTLRPAYDTFVKVKELLRGAAFKSRQAYEDKIIYNFSKDAKEFWVLWSPDDAVREISLADIGADKEFEARQITANSESALLTDTIRISKDPIVLWEKESK